MPQLPPFFTDLAQLIERHGTKAVADEKYHGDVSALKLEWQVCIDRPWIGKQMESVCERADNRIRLAQQAERLAQEKAEQDAEREARDQLKAEGRAMYERNMARYEEKKIERAEREEARERRRQERRADEAAKEEARQRRHEERMKKAEEARATFGTGRGRPRMYDPLSKAEQRTILEAIVEHQGKLTPAIQSTLIDREVFESERRSNHMFRAQAMHAATVGRRYAKCTEHVSLADLMYVVTHLLDFDLQHTTEEREVVVKQKVKIVRAIYPSKKDPAGPSGEPSGAVEKINQQLPPQSS